jgi:mono/diheme cytochrome c family protein
MKPLAYILWVCVMTGTAVANDANAVNTVFNKYCLDCHDADSTKGDLNLESLNPDNLSPHLATWETVIRKLRHQHMPPVGEPRPNEADYEKVVNYLVSTIDTAAAEQLNPGRTDTFRRLTRTEYHNAVRDLLGLKVDVTALLPKDEISHGFDNITVGELSPTQLEKYLAAAKQISRLALGRPVHAPTARRFLVPIALTQEKHHESFPLGSRGGAALTHNFPVDGEYEFQLRLMRNRNEKVEGLRGKHSLDLLIDSERVAEFLVEGGKKQDLIDRDLNVRVNVSAGAHRVIATFAGKSSALSESRLQPYQASFNMDRHPRSQPAIYTITIDGPFTSEGPGESASRKLILDPIPGTKAEEDDCATTIIGRIMRQAYRRPVTDADLAVPLKFFKETRDKEGFDSGVEMALRAILVSPHFLFKVEQDPKGMPAGSAYGISDIELATRLSFFLWSSIPDDELLDVAVAGDLYKPEVMAQQVQRMLADPRSKALVTNFAEQWLYLRNLDSARPDPRLFMDFDENLRQAMKRETELFIGSVIDENRSVLELLQADYSFVNERLAKHYGLPNIYGSRFRRVNFEPGSVRGGLLSQASVLTVTSFANRTSPVVRGKWILSNILGMPPKPPPPEVPELSESKENVRETASLRDRVAKHREKKACAACHDPMDPLGFALENFDAIGRWRTEDQQFAIDARGNMPDGTAFDGVVEMRQALLKKPDLFVTTVTEKMMVYALGRGLEHYDQPTIRKIISDAREDDFAFRSVILGIVQSTPFQKRTAQ